MKREIKISSKLHVCIEKFPNYVKSCIWRLKFSLHTRNQSCWIYFRWQIRDQMYNWCTALDRLQVRSNAVRSLKFHDIHVWWSDSFCKVEQFSSNQEVLFCRLCFGCFSASSITVQVADVGQRTTNYIFGWSALASGYFSPQMPLLMFVPPPHSVGIC